MLAAPYLRLAARPFAGPVRLFTFSHVRLYTSKPADAEPQPSLETKAPESPEPLLAAQLEDARKQIDELTLKHKDVMDKYLRALADTENVRARYRKEVETTKAFAIKGFAKSLVQVADTFELALKSFDASAANLDAIFKGMELTNLELHRAFSENGLVRFSANNEAFDPNVHDAVMRVADPSLPPNTVKDTYKVGYKLNNIVLRPATVSVVMD